LFAFTERYAGHLRLKTREVTPQANQYLCGLMQSGKRNMERIAEVVPESDEQRYQHFLSVSAWNERAVLDQVAREANRLSGGTAESALILDESGILKSGTKSVGVGRQYIGQLGKVDNCQTGVYAMHSLGERTALVDEWLYLPGLLDRRSGSLRGGGRAGTQEQDGTGSGDGAPLAPTRHPVCLGGRGRAARQGSRLPASAGGRWRMFPDRHPQRDQRLYLEDPEPAVPKRKASATGSSAVQGRQGAGRDGPLPGARLEVLAPPHGNGSDGDAVLLEKRLRRQTTYPLLSCAEIVRLLAELPPRRDRIEEERIRQMEVRHRKRQASIDAAYRKQQWTDAMAATG